MYTSHAPAKINLFLQVVGKRPDGFHELNNVFLPLLELHDIVSLEPLADRQSSYLTADGDYVVPADASNLCLKALDAFAAATGQSPHVHLHLTKRIPVAAGLGGGSSDAAATLLLLNQLYKSPLDASQLRKLAQSLGSDVPFFLHPVPSLGTGRGDMLQPLDVRMSGTLLLWTPAFPVPVAWSFAHRLQPGAPQVELDDFLQTLQDAPSLQALAPVCRNDLEHALFRKFALLELMRSQLLAAGASCVHVSGSGPSLFAIVPDDRAETMRQHLADAFPTFPHPTLHRLQR